MSADTLALGQGGLFEAPPPRAVVVDRTIAKTPSWWALDSSTSEYVLGWVSTAPGPFSEGWRTPDGLWRGAHAVKLGGTNENWGERLWRWSDQLRRLIVAMLEGGIPAPGFVYVEQASGEHVSPTMNYATGVAVQTLYGTLKGAMDYVPRVEFTTSGHWKASGVGHGGIRKPKWKNRAQWEAVREDYGVLKWARLQGFTEDGTNCWDKADAMAMAEAGRRDVAIRG